MSVAKKRDLLSFNLIRGDIMVERLIENGNSPRCTFKSFYEIMYR
jgi:hypothetical protein